MSSDSSSYLVSHQTTYCSKSDLATHYEKKV